MVRVSIGESATTPLDHAKGAPQRALLHVEVVVLFAIPCLRPRHSKHYVFLSALSSAHAALVMAKSIERGERGGICITVYTVPHTL